MGNIFILAGLLFGYFIFYLHQMGTFGSLWAWVTKRGIAQDTKPEQRRQSDSNEIELIGSPIIITLSGGERNRYGVMYPVKNIAVVNGKAYLIVPMLQNQWYRLLRGQKAYEEFSTAVLRPENITYVPVTVPTPETREGLYPVEGETYVTRRTIVTFFVQSKDGAAKPVSDGDSRKIADIAGVEVIRQAVTVNGQKADAYRVSTLTLNGIRPNIPSFPFYLIENGTFIFYK